MFKYIHQTQVWHCRQEEFLIGNAYGTYDCIFYKTYMSVFNGVSDADLSITPSFVGQEPGKW